MTMDDVVNDLADEFALLEDWEARYRHVIELGAALPALKAEAKTDANRVKGCVSQVWLVAEAQEGDPPILTFRADSDAHIVRGLVAILLAIYSGRAPDEILAFDAEAALAKLGLDAHLSPQRANGLRAMVTRIRETAATL